MINRKTLPKVLLMLAAFVFFSTNSVHFLDDSSGSLHASIDQRYNFDFDNVRGKRPYLNLKAGLLINYDNGEVLYAKNADEPRSIASLSKLVSAMVFLDHNLDLDSVVTISREDAHNSAKSRLWQGYHMTLRDLFHASLMASDNRATRALARAACGTYKAFAVEMNRKVRELGLKNTVFFEPTGLDDRNQSTAHEIAKILHYAMDYPLIHKITSTRRYVLHAVNSRGRKRQIRIGNTNNFVLSPYRVIGGKTGFIIESDYCLATLLENRQGERLTAVVLGVPGKRLRYREARRLVDWGFRQI
jgi:D-alanyl-D-alanine endopeptidase (penicillin-binding protein 7)